MLDCTDAAIKHYSLNPVQWRMVKNMCEGLLNKKERKQYVFHHKKDGDNDCKARGPVPSRTFIPKTGTSTQGITRVSTNVALKLRSGPRMHVTSISCFISCKPIQSTSRTIIILLRWRPIAGSW